MTQIPPLGPSVQPKCCCGIGHIDCTVHASFKTLSQDQEKTKSIYAIFSFSRRFYPKQLTVRTHISSVCLLPVNKTTEDLLVKREFRLVHAPSNHSWLADHQRYFKVSLFSWSKRFWGTEKSIDLWKNSFNCRFREIQRHDFKCCDRVIEVVCWEICLQQQNWCTCAKRRHFEVYVSP